MPWLTCARRSKEGEIPAPVTSDRASVKDVDVDESKLQVVNAGSGGVSEMATFMSDSQTMWALLRIEYEVDKQAKTKVAFLQFIGKKTSKAQKDEAKALNSMVSHLLRSRGKDHFHASIVLREVEDVVPEVVMAEMSESFVMDSPSMKSSARVKSDYDKQLVREEEKQLISGQHQRRLQMRAERKARRKELTAQILDVPGKSDMPAGKEAPLPETVKIAAQRSSLSRKPSVLLGQLSIEGLTQVGKGGLWNWVLVGPDLQKMPFLGGGSGGIDEMRETAVKNEDIVMYGLLRVKFSVTGFSQTRFCILHIIGENAPTVKRGRWNAARPQFEKRFGDFASITAVCPDVATKDVTLDTVLGKLSYTSDYLVEGSGNVSAIRAYQETLIADQKEAEVSRKTGPIQKLRTKLLEEEEPEDVAKDTDAGQSLKHGDDQQPTPAGGVDVESDDDEEALYADEGIDEVTRLVRDRECNWLLIRPRHRPADNVG